MNFCVGHEGRACPRCTLLSGFELAAMTLVQYPTRPVLPGGGMDLPNHIFTYFTCCLRARRTASSSCSDAFECACLLLFLSSSLCDHMRTQFNPTSCTKDSVLVVSVSPVAAIS